jgi:lipoprotein-releasing system permease protein
MKKSPILKIALTHLLSKRRQTLVAMLGVTFGIAVFIFQAGLITGFQTTFIEQTVNTTANIRIYNEADKHRKPILEQHKKENEWVVVSNQKPKNEDPKIKNGYQIMNILEHDPEVAGVSPFLGAQAIFKMGISQVAGRVSGVDIVKENLIFKVGEYMIQGDILRLQTIPNGIILGEGLAGFLGAAMNDNITVISPQGTSLEMKVVGINRTGLTNVDNTRAYINLRNAQKLLNVDGAYITDINIKLKDIDKAEVLAAAYTQKFGYKAEDWKSANANIFGVFKIQNLITYLIIISILIVSGFGIFNILMMIIYEKMPDIAILKAIGFRDAEIRRIFLTESLIIGTLGGLLGLLLGFVITHIIGSIPMNIKGFISMEYLKFNSSPLFYIFAFVFAIITTALAGYIPARKAAKIDPIDIIRSK